MACIRTSGPVSSQSASRTCKLLERSCFMDVERLPEFWSVGISLIDSERKIQQRQVLLMLAIRADALVFLVLGLSSAVAQLFFPAQQAGLANDFPTRRSTVLAWNNSALFMGISLGSLIGGEAVAIGDFDTILIISASIVLIGCIINEIVVPRPTQPIRAASGT